MKKLAFVCVVLLIIAAPATVRAAAPANDLKQIGLAYHAYYDSFNKAPTTVEDLEPFYDKNKEITKLLTSGDIVFIFGVSLANVPDGTSNTVLAYQKQTAEKGGWVLMVDGSVKKMTAEEFQKAPKGK